MVFSYVFEKSSPAAGYAQWQTVYPHNPSVPKQWSIQVVMQRLELPSL
jgi:hypothetical protein